MLFCPTCANLLVISSETGSNKWACNTCAYEFPITKQVGRGLDEHQQTSFISDLDDFEDAAEAERG